MKQYHAVVVFLALVLSSAVAGVGSYGVAREKAYAQINHALRQTLVEQRDDAITPDTVRQFRQRIPLPALREESRIVVVAAGRQMECRAECSFGAIWQLSDQRLSVALSLLALLWGVCCWFWRARSLQAAVPIAGIAYGGISLCEETGCFYDGDGREIHFTPMQQQLMTLFFKHPAHQLAKADICEQLWPKKEDAADSLYTFMRRLKPVLEQTSGLRVESLRGRAYRLVCKASDNCQ